MKRFIALLLAACLLCAGVLSGCGNKPDNTGNDSPSSDNSQSAKKPDGLTMQNGKLMKGGEEFYGVGVNYFDMFTGVFYEKWNLSEVMSALENLKSYDCKVIRFSTLPFYAKDMGYYLQVEDT